MADDLPACLRTMSPKSRRSLAEDLERWGAECASLSYRQILSHTDIGSARAERLCAWLKRNPPPLGGTATAPPTTAPSVTVTQVAADEIKVEVKGQHHPSAELGQGVVRNLSELVAEAAIDLSEWAADDFTVRTWSTPMRMRRKDADDELAVVRNWYASAKFHRRLDGCVSAADWGERVKRTPRPAAKVMTALCIPDIHIGYRWSRGHQALVPLHDWAALDAVLQLLEVAGPDVVQILGDVLDHAAMSTKFQVPLALRDTVRPSLLTTHAILRSVRLAARCAAIDWTGGNHDCHDTETECLTRRGWLRYDELRDDDQVLSLDTDTWTCEWSPINRRVVADYSGPMVSIDAGGVRALVTPNHRVLTGNRIREWGFEYAENLTGAGRRFIPASGDMPNPGVQMSDDEIALAGWILTDGGISTDGRVSIYQSKDGAEIERLLTALGLEHTKSTRNRKIEAVCGRELVAPPRPQVEYRLRAASSRRVREWLPSKAFPAWAGELSGGQFEVFIRAIIAGDGSWAKSGRAACIYGKRDFLDAVQAVAVQHGWRARISQARHNDHRLYVCRAPTLDIDCAQTVSMVEYTGKVWCLTVPRGNFMIRRNGAAHFSGNSRSERAHIGTEWDGMTTAADPGGPPVLSFAHLLGLDALDITHRDYGAHRFLFDSILVHHGDKVKSRGGLTVADTIRDAQTSVVFGHIHRVEQASKTLHTPHGPKVITAVSPGTLARIDGSVPGVSERPDWQQGVAVCTYDTETGQDHWELVHIHAGRLHWRGHAIQGDGARLSREVAAQIKYPQIAEAA